MATIIGNRNKDSLLGEVRRPSNNTRWPQRLMIDEKVEPKVPSRPAGRLSSRAVS